MSEEGEQSISVDLDEIADIELLNEQNSHLRQKNEQYIETIASLKAQLNQALEFSEQNALLQKENSKLLTQIRNLSFEKDEIENRLSIMARKLEESKKEPKLQETCPIPKQIELHNKIQKLEELVKSLTEEKIDLQNQIKKQSKQNQKSNDDCKSTINNIISAAKVFFDDPIDNVEQLISLLLNPPEESVVQGEIDNSEEIFKLERKISKHKKLIEKIKKEYFDQSNELENAKGEIQILEAKTQQEKRQSENQIRDLCHKVELLEMQNKNNAENYEAQIVSLRGIISELKSKHNNNQTTIITEDHTDELKDQIKSHLGQLREASATNSTLKTQIITLTSQIQSLERNINSLTNKNKILLDEKEETQKTIHELQMRVTTLETANKSLDSKLQAALAQVKSARISYKQSRETVAETEAYIDKKAEAISYLEKQFASQRAELSVVYKERDRVMNLVRSLVNGLKLADNQIQKIKRENDSLRDRIQKPQTPVKQATKKDDFIPITSWFCSEFPRDLCASISDFAKNEALNAPAKLKNVLLCIAKYYNIKLKEGATKITEIKEDSDKRRLEFENFISKLSEVVEFPVNDINNRDIFDHMQKILKAADGRGEEAERTKEELNLVLGKLEVDTADEAVEELNKLFKHVDQQAEEITALIIGVKKAKKTIKRLETNSKDSFEKCQKLEKELTTRSSALETELNRVQKELHEAQNQLAQAKCEIDSIKAQHTIDLEKAAQERDEVSTAVREQVGRIRTQADKDLSDREEKIGELNQRICELERALDDRQIQIDTFTEEKARLYSEIEEGQRKMEEMEQGLRTESERQRDAIRNQYEALVKEMKNKNDELCVLHERLSNSLSDSEKRLKESQERLGKTCSELERARMKAQSDADEWCRERRIIESKAQARILGAELKAQTAIDEARSQQDMETRKLLAAITSDLAPFFDTSRRLSAEAVRECASKAREEIERLRASEDSIRRLLGIQNSESPENALSQLLLTLYSK